MDERILAYLMQVLILAAHLDSGHGDRIFDQISDRVGNLVVVGAGMLWLSWYREAATPLAGHEERNCASPHAVKGS